VYGLIWLITVDYYEGFAEIVFIWAKETVWCRSQRSAM
jgi:hypothetical protein